MNLYIGSGDTTDLLSGIHTKGYNKLWERFVAIEKPFYNALASPIPALRTGAILEERFFYAIDEAYLKQYKVRSKDMDVSRSSLDFANIEYGEVKDFIELKTAYITDYQEIFMYKDSSVEEYMSFFNKSSQYRHNIAQVQKQLFDTGLESANLCFLEVQTYNDDVNYFRDIKTDEYVMFRIYRDEGIISKIKERLTPFQQLKDYYDKNIKPCQ